MSTAAPHPQHHATRDEDSNDVPEMYTPDDNRYIEHDVRTFLSWHAPGRPFKQHSKEYFMNGFLIMLAVEIIIYLVFKEFLLMLLVFSFVFLAYALALVPPRDLYYKITSEGIRIEDHVFIWDELYDFYFLPQNGQDMLHVRTKVFFPGELLLTLGDVPVNQIKKIIIPYLPYREYVNPTFTEQAGDWLQKNFPLEKSPHI